MLTVCSRLQEKRGLVMAIFNWGIYGGYGIAFPVGRYVTEMDAWGLVSSRAGPRAVFAVAGPP